MPAIGDEPELNLETVVYAADFSLCSKNAGFYAARMATYFSARLLVTHAFTLAPAAIEVEIRDRQLSQQRNILTHLLSKEAALLRADSVETIPVLLEGEPEYVVPGLAAIEHPDRLADLQTRFFSALEAFVPQYAKEFCDSRTSVAVGGAHNKIREHIGERSLELLVSVSGRLRISAWR